MSLPRYDAYKPSGVEWLGKLPEHWKLDRLKRSVTSCKNGIWGDEAQQDENDITCVRVADFDRQRLRVELNDPTIRNITEKERTGRVLKRGDLLLEKSGGGENQPVGCVVLYDDPRPAVCSNFVARMQITDGMSPTFWRYVHAAAYAIRLTTRSINQTSGIQNLDQDRYFNEQVPFPPLEEQQTIADFLDAQSAKIDTLLAKKRQFIAKLKEKRSALIARTVTRGLPPDAAQAAGLEPHPAMKDSGVEWVGTIPAHWIVTQLRRYVTFITSGSRGWAEHYSDSGSVFVRIGNLTRDSLAVDLSDIQYVEPPAGTEGERTKIKAGDLLFSITAYLGSIAVASDDLAGAFVSQHIALVRLASDTFVPRYAGYYVLSDAGQSQLNEQGYGGTKVQLSLGDVKALWFPIPPKNEQQAIAAYLDRETARIDQLTAKVEAAIARLTEYRQALITAAVTGRIDVRDNARIKEAAI